MDTGAARRSLAKGQRQTKGLTGNALRLAIAAGLAPGPVEPPRPEPEREFGRIQQTAKILDLLRRHVHAGGGVLHIREDHLALSVLAECARSFYDAGVRVTEATTSDAVLHGGWDLE